MAGACADTDCLSYAQALGNSVIEGYISALDDACQKYLDDKIDKVRFKKGYQAKIRNTVQDPAHEGFFKPGHTFHALWKVFDDWENPEKG